MTHVCIPHAHTGTHIIYHNIIYIYTYWESLKYLHAYIHVFGVYLYPHTRLFNGNSLTCACTCSWAVDMFAIGQRGNQTDWLWKEGRQIYRYTDRDKMLMGPFTGVRFWWDMMNCFLCWGENEQQDSILWELAWDELAQGLSGSATNVLIHAFGHVHMCMCKIYDHHLHSWFTHGEPSEVSVQSMDQSPHDALKSVQSAGIITSTFWGCLVVWLLGCLPIIYSWSFVSPDFWWTVFWWTSRSITCCLHKLDLYNCLNVCMQEYLKVLLYPAPDLLAIQPGQPCSFFCTYCHRCWIYSHHVSIDRKSRLPSTLGKWLSVPPWWTSKDQTIWVFLKS